MKKEVGVKVNQTFGDCLFATPTIKYLSESINQKISVETNFPDIFKNNPYIYKIYNSSKGELLPEDIIFYDIDKQFSGDLFKQRKMHTIDCYSLSLGFTLNPNEKTMIYFPDECDIDLPKEKYVVINPSVTTECRTWDKEKWEELINLIIGVGYKVVVVGKDISYEHDFNRGVLNITNPNVINLVNKLNISQLWHILENSFCVFTMNAGLWTLLGTTDTNIISMTSTIHPHYRAPFRNGTQDYKQKFVGGLCKIFCHTDMKYNSNGDVKISGGFPVAGCFENKPTYECHPSVDDVFKTFLSLL